MKDLEDTATRAHVLHRFELTVLAISALSPVCDAALTGVISNDVRRAAVVERDRLNEVLNQLHRKIMRTP